jgi:hypothetical protein
MPTGDDCTTLAPLTAPGNLCMFKLSEDNITDPFSPVRSACSPRVPGSQFPPLSPHATYLRAFRKAASLTSLQWPSSVRSWSPRVAPTPSFWLNPCNWTGVFCEGNGTVYKLDLVGWSLMGGYSQDGWGHLARVHTIREILLAVSSKAH